MWDGKSNVGDGGAIAGWNASADDLHQYTSIGLVLESVGQFGLLLKFLEEDMGRVGAHSYLTHLFLMDELDGGVSELLSEHFSEFIPCWVLISGSCFVVCVFFWGTMQARVDWDVPIVVTEVYPPILHVSL